MQAKDISDTQFLELVDKISGTPWKHIIPEVPLLRPRWVMRWELEELGPEKVVLAKAKKLIKKGLLDGCPCGCRGDFELTSAGFILLKTSR